MSMAESLNPPPPASRQIVRQTGVGGTLAP